MVVDSLYTNISHADGVAACRTYLSKHNIQSDIATDIPVLIVFMLKHNMFAFNDKYYLKQMTQAYAIISMESVEIFLCLPFHIIRQIH